jgi:hypothetical protein
MIFFYQCHSREIASTLSTRSFLPRALGFHGLNLALSFSFSFVNAATAEFSSESNRFHVPRESQSFSHTQFLS